MYILNPCIHTLVYITYISYIIYNKTIEAEKGCDRKCGYCTSSWQRQRGRQREQKSRFLDTFWGRRFRGQKKAACQAIGTSLACAVVCRYCLHLPRPTRYKGIQFLLQYTLKQPKAYNYCIQLCKQSNCRYNFVCPAKMTADGMPAPIYLALLCLWHCMSLWYLCLAISHGTRSRHTVNANTAKKWCKKPTAL